uniref:M24 family metallopeptidase n=1 Tax=Bacillus velezensis TaxID=492670 RepID=UPI0011A8ABEB
IEKGELVRVDLGGYYKGYCCDMRGRVGVGEGSDKVKEIYEVVYDGEGVGVVDIKGGMRGKEGEGVRRDEMSGKG